MGCDGGGVVWDVMLCHVMVRNGRVWDGMVWDGMGCYVMLRYGTVGCGMAWDGMVWYGEVSLICLMVSYYH